MAKRKASPTCCGREMEQSGLVTNEREIRAAFSCIRCGKSKIQVNQRDGKVDRTR